MSLVDLCGGGWDNACFLNIGCLSWWSFECILMRSYFCPGPPEQFDNWLSGFSLEDKKAEISELLVNSPSIRALYTKMVVIVAFFNTYSYRAHPPVLI